jgi:HMG box factor, other
MSFNRVLPKPLALYHDPISGREFTRRSSSLLEHKIMTADNLTQGSSSGEAAQRADPRPESPMVVINSQASRINSSQREAREADNPPLGPLLKKRAATEMSATSNPTRELSSKPTSAPGTAIESSAHFCLCQPDPKIPRPRNGTFFNSLLEVTCSGDLVPHRAYLC